MRDVAPGLRVQRFLPTGSRRLVGGFCFADRFSAETIQMHVPAHPHCGLQTVSWLVEGQNVHRDSLGHTATNGPSELAVMTSGHGISHEERTPPGHQGPSLGVQLWVALPDAHRHTAPDFALYRDLPARPVDDAILTELFGGASPARSYSPLVLQQVQIPAGGRCTVPLDPDHEHAILPLRGTVDVDGRDLADTLVYLGTQRQGIQLTARTDALVLVLGGEPLREEVLIWWNFVARTWDELKQATLDWTQHTDRFGDLGDAQRVEPPALPRSAR